MIKWVLFMSSSFVLALCFGFFGPNLSASALSPDFSDFDYVTDNLSLKTSDYYACEDYNDPFNGFELGELIGEPENWFNSNTGVGAVWTPMRGNIPDRISLFNDALDNGSVVIKQVFPKIWDSNTYSVDEIEIYFSLDKTINLDFLYSSSSDRSRILMTPDNNDWSGIYNMKIRNIYHSGNSYRCGMDILLRDLGDSPPSSTVTVADELESRGSAHLAIYSAFGDDINITYPPNYAGVDIPSTNINDASNEDIFGEGFQPSFDISWDNLDITLTDKTTLEKLDEFNIETCAWGINDSNWSEINLVGEYTCDDHTDVEYTMPSLGTYQIGLNYWSSDGKLYQSTYLLNLDGGSGSDSINDPFYTTAIGRVFKKHMNSDYGLEKFFLAPINFVASLPSKVGSCSPINYTLMGENVQLKCLSTTVWNRPFLSTIVNIYQILLLAGVTYFVATSTYHVIKSATNPLDDKLDVLKL